MSHPESQKVFCTTKLRDTRLRPTTSLEDFRKALEQELNQGQLPGNTIELKLRQSDDNLLSAMLRSHRVESWQVRWHMPRPSLVGLAAGSCIVFQVESGRIDGDRLKQLELSGIGERRAEGYGQLCFNPLLLSQKFEQIKSVETQELSESKYSSNLESLKPSSLSDRDPIFNYAHLIETAAWREAIYRAALFLASTQSSREDIIGIRIRLRQDDKTNQIKGEPSMTQLGGLRAKLSQLRSPSQENAVTRWIAGIREKKSDKWNETNDGLSKIQKLVTEAQIVWQHIQMALADSKMEYPSLQELTLTQDGENTLKAELWAETVQVLMDACIRAHKRELEEPRLPNESTSVTVGANHVS